MRQLAVVLLLMLLGPAISRAQTPKFEIGTKAGITVLTNGGDLVNLSVPGGGPSPFGSLLGSSTIHAAFFAGDRFSIEPQVNLSVISNGETVTNLILGLQGNYFAEGNAAASAYAGPSLGFVLIDTGRFDSETDVALGAGIGYRFLPLEFLALRFEGFYRRWLDFEVNEFGATFAFGAVVD